MIKCFPTKLDSVPLPLLVLPQNSDTPITPHLSIAGNFYDHVANLRDQLLGAPKEGIDSDRNEFCISRNSTSLLAS